MSSTEGQVGQDEPAPQRTTSIERQINLLASELGVTPEQLRTAADRAAVRLSSHHPLPAEVAAKCEADGWTDLHWEAQTKEWRAFPSDAVMSVPVKVHKFSSEELGGLITRLADCIDQGHVSIQEAGCLMEVATQSVSHNQPLDLPPPRDWTYP